VSRVPHPSARNSVPNGRERKVTSREGHHRNTLRRLTFRRELWDDAKRVSLHFEPLINPHSWGAPHPIIFFFYYIFARNHLCVTRFLRLCHIFPDECSNRRESACCSRARIRVRAYTRNPCRCTMYLSNNITRHSFSKPRSLNALSRCRQIC